MLPAPHTPAARASPEASASLATRAGCVSWPLFAAAALAANLAVIQLRLAIPQGPLLAAAAVAAATAAAAAAVAAAAAASAAAVATAPVAGVSAAAIVCRPPVTLARPPAPRVVGRPARGLPMARPRGPPPRLARPAARLRARRSSAPSTTRSPSAVGPSSWRYVRYLS